MNQKGFSLTSMILFFLVFSVTAIFGLQIGQGYLNQKAIHSAVKNALIEAKKNNEIKSKDIVNSVIKQASISSIDISSEDIDVVEKGGRKFDVEVSMLKKIKITEKIKLVINLDFKENSDNI
jgi:hypothetical protein